MRVKRHQTQKQIHTAEANENLFMESRRDTHSNRKSDKRQQPPEVGLWIRNCANTWPKDSYNRKEEIESRLWATRQNKESVVGEHETSSVANKRILTHKVITGKQIVKDFSVSTSMRRSTTPDPHKNRFTQQKRTKTYSTNHHGTRTQAAKLKETTTAGSGIRDQKLRENPRKEPIENRLLQFMAKQETCRLEAKNGCQTAR